MTKTEFEQSFGLLESAFGEQDPQRRQFYYRQFEHSLSWVFNRAIRRIIEIRDDGYGFPLIAEIRTSMDEVLRQRSEADEADLGIREFCQCCGNSGLYQTSEGAAVPCVCRAGRLKQARLILGLSARRTEVEEYTKTRLPPAEPPMHGLQEKNPLGFWELAEEEHDRWMADKREQIADLERRRSTEPEKKLSPSDEFRFDEIKTAAARVKFQDRFPAPAEREPGEDDDAVPF